MAEENNYKSKFINLHKKNQKVHFLNNLHFDILKKLKEGENLSQTEKEFETVTNIIYSQEEKIINLKQNNKELKQVLLYFILTLIITFFILIVLT